MDDRSVIETHWALRWRNAMAMLKLLSLSEADVRAGRVLTTDEVLAGFDEALAADDAE
jgi:hypothetical protein